jgi:hypothetical protein
MTVTESATKGPEIAPPGVKLASALGQSVIPANSLTDVGEPGGRSTFLRWRRWQAKTADA